MKNYDKCIKSSYIQYLDANNLYCWAMAQILHVNGFKWVGKLSKFNERFIKIYNENSDKGHFLEVDLEYPKKLFSFHEDLPFLPERKENRKSQKACLYRTRKRKLFSSHKSFKTSTKSWIDI